ncbi:hypothetical protein K2Q16_03480 [Patescibacteria group bacterium]|nr:hypothetical protein [Patescibacteria group bacterium]
MKNVLFKVLPDKLPDWESWCFEVRNRETEAKETMQYEHCVYERFIIFERAGEWYTVGSTEFLSEPRPADMNVDINKRHHEMRDKCLSKALVVFFGEIVLPPNYSVLYEFDLRN